MANNQNFALLHHDMVEQEAQVAKLVDMVGRLQNSVDNLTIVGQEESWAEFIRGWLEATIVTVNFFKPALVTLILWVMSRSRRGWKLIPVVVVPLLMVSQNGTLAGLALICGDTVRSKVRALLGSWPMRMLGLGGEEEQSVEEPQRQWSLLAPWTWTWFTGSGSGGQAATGQPDLRQQDSPV